MEATIILGGLELGMKAIQAWNEYNADLIALQAQRAAEGKPVTMEEVNIKVAATRGRIAANHDILQAAQAAQEASKNPV
jgi:hypothetical protein